MKQMLRIMTPTRDVLNDIMLLADKRRSSRWSVPVLHHFPIERPIIPTRSTLYMIRGTAPTPQRRRMIIDEHPQQPVMLLPQMRLIPAPQQNNRSRWGMYVFPTDTPIITRQAEPVVVRPIRKKKKTSSTRVSLHAFPSLTKPKRVYSQLRMIRQSLREL